MRWYDDDTPFMTAIKQILGELKGIRKALERLADQGEEKPDTLAKKPKKKKE